LRQTLHADEEPTLGTLAARPIVYEAVYSLPAAQVEVADAEVRALAKGKRFLQGGQEWFCYVVKDPWHGMGMGCLWWGSGDERGRGGVDCAGQQIVGSSSEELLNYDPKASHRCKAKA